jgi:nicotinate-nucleotide adenylyltransferase
VATVSALGILGGSFNPPHLGHLALARAAASELALERVLLVPVFLPPHKPPAADDPGPMHRLAMCKALVAGVERVEASTLEIDRGGRSYTIDTLEAVHASQPAAELNLILGADMACTLPSWRRPRDIVRLAGVAVAERGPGWEEAEGGGSRERVATVLHALDPEARIAVLSMPPVDVSSTMVRTRLAEGGAWKELVGPAVASYIVEHRLYGAHKAVVR